MIRPVRTAGSRAIAAGRQCFLIAKAPFPGSGLKARRRDRPDLSSGRSGSVRCLALACALAFLWPGGAASVQPAWSNVDTRTCIVKLSPFRVLYGVPGSSGEIAVTGDDGLHRSTPGIGLHAALRWRL